MVASGSTTKRRYLSPGQMTWMQFQRLTISTDREQPWELDGEVMGGTTRLMITALPSRLVLRVPPAAAG